MIERAVMWLGWQMLEWLNAIEVPLGAWQLLGDAYGGLVGVIGMMAKLPFVPWTALATTVTLVLGVWFALMTLSMVLRILMFKWGSGS